MNRSAASRGSSLTSPSYPSSPATPTVSAIPASLGMINGNGNGNNFANGTARANGGANGTTKQARSQTQSNPPVTGTTTTPSSTTTTTAPSTTSRTKPETLSRDSATSSQPTSTVSSPPQQPSSQSQQHHVSIQSSSQPPPPSSSKHLDKHQVDAEQVRKALEATKLDKRKDPRERSGRIARSEPSSANQSTLVSRSNSKNQQTRGGGGNDSSTIASGLTTPGSRAPSVNGGNSGDGNNRKQGPSSVSSSGNANLAPPTPAPSGSTAKLSRESSKGKVTSRLSRMFQQSNKAVHKDLEAVKDFIEDAPRSDDGNSSVNTSNPMGPAKDHPNTPMSTTPLRSSAAASDKESRDGEREKDRDREKERKQDSRKQAATEALSRRFEVHPDGTHSHHLKAAKRQEKLSDMWRDMFGAGKKKEEAAEKAILGHPADDQQLSLMSSWVEQLKSEKEKTSSKKSTSSPPASLVDKYGKCQEIVGRGAFGVVRISHKIDPKDSRTERLFAVKEFRRRPQETAKKYQKRLTSEFCISSSLRHPNIIHTLDLMPDAKGDYCAVMEYCAGGDLYTLILAAGKLDVGEADCFFKQVMRGVEYMHEMGVAHRDLKPENLLLTTHGAVKITDFGNGECFRMAWEKEAHMTAGLCGSAPYIAPEEYVNKEFDPRAVDVWATGVIYMAMRTGRHLWRVAQKDEDEFYQKYLQGRRDEDGYAPIETLHRARCRNVIYSILDPNPTRRITASQVLKSEWLRDIR
ncbi:serine/threonine-protein kinase HAL4/sat4, partial [Ascosphaera aggregata]